MLVDLADRLRREFEDRPLVLRDKPPIAVAETVDAADAVEEVQLHHHAPDHVVESRAQAAAGDDPGAGLDGSKKIFRPRPGRLEPGNLVRGQPARVKAEAVSSKRTRSDSSTL